MRFADLLRFSLLALRRQRFRSGMLLTAVGLGVAAVVVLTALGEGARGYVLGEFAYLGKDTVIMFPGRKETTGGMPPMTGTAAHVTPIIEIDHRKVGRGSIGKTTKKLQSMYFDVILGKNKKYMKWCTPVYDTIKP